MQKLSGSFPRSSHFLNRYELVCHNLFLKCQERGIPLYDKGNDIRHIVDIL